MTRVAAVVMLGISMAFLASACFWGVVTDADTGAPVPGAVVSYTDSDGYAGTTTTDASGFYAFDIASGPVPATGPVALNFSHPDYWPATAPRLIEYNDNPNAGLHNLSSFWEVQNFALESKAVQNIEVELEGVDVRKALLAPPGGQTAYRVTFRAYGFADPFVPVCEHTSGPVFISSADPPNLPLNLDCVVVDSTFRATVTVTLERVGPGPTEADISTAEWPWTAPAPDSSWAYGLIDSSDAAAPDDPDLEFDAQIRYRLITLIPLSQ